MRLHETSQAGGCKSVREAIDQAMKAQGEHK